MQLLELHGVEYLVRLIEVVGGEQRQAHLHKEYEYAVHEVARNFSLTYPLPAEFLDGVFLEDEFLLIVNVDVGDEGNSVKIVSELVDALLAVGALVDLLLLLKNVLLEVSSVHKDLLHSLFTNDFPLNAVLNSFLLIYFEKPLCILELRLPRLHKYANFVELGCECGLL